MEMADQALTLLIEVYYEELGGWTFVTNKIYAIYDFSFSPKRATKCVQNLVELPSFLPDKHLHHCKSVYLLRFKRKLSWVGKLQHQLHKNLQYCKPSQSDKHHKPRNGCNNQPCAGESSGASGAPGAFQEDSQLPAQHCGPWNNHNKQDPRYWNARPIKLKIFFSKYSDILRVLKTYLSRTLKSTLALEAFFLSTNLYPFLNSLVHPAFIPSLG